MTIAAHLVGTVRSHCRPWRRRTLWRFFRPGTTPHEVFAGVAAVDGRIIWSDATGELWGIDLGSGATSRPLYRHGALVVSSSLFPIGCLPWLRA